MVENEDSRLQPFTSSSPPKKTIPAIALRYPSGRIEVYKIEKISITSQGLTITGDLRIRKFNHGEIVRGRYNVRTITSTELNNPHYEVYYI